MSAASAAQAAQAAVQASQQVLESTEALRRSDLLRSLIQKPDVFKPETRESEVDGWTEWRHGMMNYLGVIDPGFIKDLAEVEANPTRTPDMSGMDGAQCGALLHPAELSQTPPSQAGPSRDEQQRV